MCRIDDCEPAEFFATTTRRARKEHRCSECRRAIGVGETYSYSAFFGDGFQTNKACAHCAAARTWLDEHCGGWVTGLLAEELGEHWDEGYTADRLPRLVVGIRRKWRRIRGEGLMPVPELTFAKRAAA